MAGIMGLCGKDFQDMAANTDMLDWDGTIADTQSLSVNSSSATGRITGAKAFKIPNNDLWVLFYRNSSRLPVARVYPVDPADGTFGTPGTALTLDGATELMIQNVFQADADNKLVVHMQGIGANKLIAIEINTSTKAITAGTAVSGATDGPYRTIVQFTSTIYGQLYKSSTDLKYNMWSLSGTTFTAETSAGTVSGVTLSSTAVDLSAIGGFDDTNALLLEVGTTTTFLVKTWKIVRSTYTLTGSASQTIIGSGGTTDASATNTDGNGDPHTQVAAGWVAASNTGDTADAYIGMFLFTQTGASTGRVLHLLVFLYDDSAATFTAQNISANVLGTTSTNEFPVSGVGMVPVYDTSPMIASFDPMDTGYFAYANYNSVQPEYHAGIGRLLSTGRVKMTPTDINLAATSTVTSRQEINIGVDTENNVILLTVKDAPTTCNVSSGVLS